MHFVRITVWLLALALSACGKQAAQEAPRQQEKQELLDHPIFNEAFSDGFSITANGSTYTFHPQHVGDLKITSGRLVACDPFVNCGNAFAKPVPAGVFPLHLAIASVGEDARVAFAKIVFAPGRIESWELAVSEGQDITTLKKGEFFGYGVDSGTGAFMDAEALKSYEARRQREGEKFDDYLFAELDKSYQHTRSWYLLDTGQGTVALFSSGYGDGVYPTWRGYDKSGKLVAVITDFGLVPWQ